MLRLCFNQVLGAFTAPTFTATLIPSNCPIIEDQLTGRHTVNWDACTPASLLLTTTPWQFDAPYISGTSFAGGFCRYVLTGRSLTCSSCLPIARLAAGESRTILKLLRSVTVMPPGTRHL
jgi:hypothetical protein